MSTAGVAPDRDDGDVFDAARSRLLGLAYRMLGTIADAEDVVQEAWLRWSRVDRASVRSPDAWLTTATTRLALDRLTSATRRRETYPGPWLPEPVVTARGPDDSAELADSLTLGFLTLLDRLGPVERAVFLLSDVFGVPFVDVAAAVGKSEVACRQIASRSRRRLQGAHWRRPTASERRLVDEAIVAMALGDVDGLLTRLSPEVVCLTDGGPTRRAARRPVVGSAKVARFLVNVTRKVYGTATAQPVTVNGDPGAVVSLDGAIDSVIACEVDREGHRVSAIWVVRAPEKLDLVLDPPRVR